MRFWKKQTEEPIGEGLLDISDPQERLNRYMKDMANEVVSIEMILWLFPNTEQALSEFNRWIQLHSRQCTMLSREPVAIRVK